MTNSERPRRTTVRKKAVTYRLPVQMIDRITAFTRDRESTMASAIELLIDESLTRRGYPAPRARTT